MDIVDIEEMLKDDSFCLMEEKGQDDITNIIQQWKINGFEGAKLDTRTYIRPKRKSLQNLETNCFNDTKSYAIMSTTGIDLQIGGLVTSLTNSPLRDTSPPFSICSSVELSVDQLNNSLITSADFTNVNFFETTNADNLVTESCDSLLNGCSSYKRSSLDNVSLPFQNVRLCETNEDLKCSLSQKEAISTKNTVHKLNCLKNQETFSRKAINNIKKIKGCIKDSRILKTDEVLCLSNICFEDDSMPSTANNALSENNICSSTTEEPLKESEKSIQNITYDLLEKKALSKSQTNGHLLSPVFNMNCSQNSLDISDKNATFNLTFQKDPEELNKETLERTFIRDESFDLKNNLNQGRTKMDIEETYMCPSHSTSDLKFTENLDLQSTPCNFKMHTQGQTPHISLSFINQADLSPIYSVKTSQNTPSKVLMDCKLKNVHKCIEQDNVLTENFKRKNNAQINYDTDEEFLTKENDELENLLRTFVNTTISEESDKMRQSLNSIKKRHALVLHKCVTDTANTETISNNTFSSSIVNSERLLTRRSRLYDEVPLENIQHSSNKSFKETNILRETNEELNYILSDKQIEATENTVKNLNDLKNQERFKTIRIIKKSDKINEDMVEPIVQIPSHTRFSGKQKNLLTANSNTIAERKGFKMSCKNSQNICKEEDELNSDLTQIYPGNKSSKIDICKNNEISFGMNSTSILEKSLSSSSAKKSILNQLPPHGTKGFISAKARSYQNLPSQFGFNNSYVQPSLQEQYLPSEEQKRTSKQQIKLNRTKQNKFTPGSKTRNEDVFKVPAVLVKARTSNNRRSGLVRPSSGYYSYNVNRSECETESSRRSSSNSLSSGNSKESVQELPNRILSEHFIGDNTGKYQDCKEHMSRRTFINKSNNSKPLGPGSTTMKKSLLPLPSHIVKR